ncbi:MAG: hypothetical protein QW057_09495, partial [Candidatus Bathyarchaeia archaeon]
VKDSNALEAALKINPSKTPIEESRQRSPPPDEDRLSPPNTPGKDRPLKVAEKSLATTVFEYHTLAEREGGR